MWVDCPSRGAYGVQRRHSSNRRLTGCRGSVILYTLDAWGAYTQGQDRAGQPVDEERVAKVDVVDSTDERALHLWSRDMSGSSPDSSH